MKQNFQKNITPHHTMTQEITQIPKKSKIPNLDSSIVNQQQLNYQQKTKFEKRPNIRLGNILNPRQIDFNVTSKPNYESKIKNPISQSAYLSPGRNCKIDSSSKENYDYKDNWNK